MVRKEYGRRQRLSSYGFVKMHINIKSPLWTSSKHLKGTFVSSGIHRCVLDFFCPFFVHMSKRPAEKGNTCVRMNHKKPCEDFTFRDFDMRKEGCALVGSFQE